MLDWPFLTCQENPMVRFSAWSRNAWFSDSYQDSRDTRYTTDYAAHMDHPKTILTSILAFRLAMYHKYNSVGEAEIENVILSFLIYILCYAFTYRSLPI